jgi:UDP-N-acetylmuramoylalanine--D-glutamate ligase
LEKTAIIGMGITGYSCLKFLHDKTDVVVVDSRVEPPNGPQARRSFPDVDYRFGPNEFDYSGVAQVIVSPGVDMHDPLVRPARERGIRLSSDIDLFCEAATAPVIAITGTNGKSTVTALAGHLIRSAGFDVGIGGNLGEPALDLLDAARDCYVLELSSFQLERLGDWPFAAATILNVSEDHIDRHGSMACYTRSKQRIYRSCGLAVVNRVDPLSVPETATARATSFGLDVPSAGHWGLQDGWLVRAGEREVQPIVAASDLPLAGSHNQLNVLAAFALASEAGVSDEVLAEGIKSFVGLPHRCQRVGAVSGVTFIDDSKATNVGATVAALQGIGDAEAKNLLLIAGGDGKGADFTALRDSVNRFVKALILLGKDARRLERELGTSIPVFHVSGMVEAVRKAQELAAPGDSVLLSPACASLDMFKNFVDRGLQFAATVAQGLR